MAHECRSCGNYMFAKTLESLDNFHWSHKARDVKTYIDGCVVCKKYKESDRKTLSEPMFLHMKMYTQAVEI